MRQHLVLAFVLGSLVAAGVAMGNEHHVNATLQPVGGSSVTGSVQLTALPQGGTVITVVASGLQPNTEYVSLYYDNGTCELEPYSADDVIGRYTSGPNGNATVTGRLEDDLDEIHSVSVRLGGDFSLVACAAVN